MATDLAKLAERVEGLQGPCRETDARVHYEVVTAKTPGFWLATQDAYAEEAMRQGWATPRYTASLDAVVALASEKLPGIWTYFLDRAVKAVWKKHSTHIRHHEVAPDEMARLTLAATLRALGDTDDR